MSVLINEKVLKEQEYLDENELQELLFENPSLLQEENDAQYYSIKREILLPSGGRLDLFLIDKHGSPIAVEVKLDRNSQSKREVVAQVIDYISDISSLNYHKLDELTEGKLDEIVNKIDAEYKLPKIINSLVNSGTIKMIIAVDHANIDLKRIMSFLKERTNLDIRLVEISKYDNGRILVPRILDDRQSKFVPKNASLSIPNKHTEMERNEEFEKVMSYYESITIPELKARNNAPKYRLIRFNKWPSTIHYEFMDKKSIRSIGIEFHIEKAKCEQLTQEIQKYKGVQIYNKVIEFDPKWSKQKGRLLFNCLYSEGPEEICKYMLEFVKITKDCIDQFVNKT